MKILFSILLLLTPWLANAAPGSVMQSGSFVGVYQFVGLPSGGYTNSFVAKVGKVKFEDDTGSSMSHKGKTIEIGGSLTALPYALFDEANPPAQSVLMQKIKDYQFQATNGAFLNDLKAFMRKQGASTLAYTYRQQIKVQGNPVTKSIIWRVIIDQNGRPRYASPRIISDVPSFVYVNYLPKAVADGLPSSFAYPNAGNYSYQLVKKDMSPLTSPVFVNVNGAFDAPRANTPPAAQPPGCQVGGLSDPDSPADQTSAFCDPDFGLKCLINELSAAGCPTAYKDVAALMDEVGADGAFVDYNREITPVYKVVCPSGATFNDQEGTCSDGSEPQERATAAIDVPLRELRQASCLPAATYENRINIGWQIKKQADRYAVLLDLTYQQTGTGSSEEATPNQAFNPILTLPNIPADISSKIIDPFENILSNVDTYENIINLAAVTRVYTGTSNFNFASGYPAKGHDGDRGTQMVYLDVNCAGGLINVNYRGTFLGGDISGSTQFVIGTPASKSTSAYNAGYKRVLMDQSTTFTYNGYDRITLSGSPQWDGVNPRDNLASHSPPPTGVAHCPAGTSLFHNYVEGSGTTFCGFGQTCVARVSELLCSHPIKAYGACPSTIQSCSSSGFGGSTCTNAPLRSQTATTCTYQVGFTQTTTNKPVTCNPGATPANGRCVSLPPLYVDLTQ